MRGNLRILIFICVALSLYSETAVAQDSTSGKWLLAIRGDYGFIIAHRPALRPLQEEHSKGLEVSVGKISSGEKEWERDFLYPSKGITAAFLIPGSSRLGNAIALYPWIDFPLNHKKNSRLDFRYGIGLGWIGRIFSAGENYKNAAIGSHLNGVIHFDLHFENYLDKRSILEISTGITHFSNASFKLPNLGLNVAAFNIGYVRNFGEKKLLNREPVVQHSRKPQWSAYIAGAEKKIYPPEGKQYQAAVFSILWIKPYTNRHGWGIGHDLFYDNSLAPRLQSRDIPLKGFSDNLRGGISGAYQVNAGNLGLMFNMGYYYFTRWKEDGNIYHRICVRYYFPKIFLCMNLKTHYARADFAEFGIGYHFN